jgi:NitT/TauT family transport system substrate-binding protein
MGAAAAAGPLVAIEAGAQGRPVVNLQLGWLLSGNQIGEVCARRWGSTSRKASS